MIRLLYFIDWLLGLYVFILIFTAIMSWLVAFDVIKWIGVAYLAYLACGNGVR